MSYVSQTGINERTAESSYADQKWINKSLKSSVKINKCTCQDKRNLLVVSLCLYFDITGIFSYK